MAISTLPLVLLTTHMMTKRRPMRASENTTKSRTVPLGGMSVRFWEGIRNPGRCHSAQRLPRMRPPTQGAVQPLNAGLGEAGPSGLLEQRSPDRDHGDEGDQVG